MKKHLLYLVAGALALSACTSEEVYDESIQNNAIGFQNVVSKQSRGDVADITYNSIKQFYVYGYYTMPSYEGNPIQIFDAESVTRPDLTKDDWNYDHTRYWVPTATYYFYAYSCNNTYLREQFGLFAMNMSGSTPNERALKISEYRCDDKHQHDLVFASKEGVKAEMSGNAPVNFKFQHLLTKVDAKFTSKFPAEYDVVISEVRFENICNIGWYNPNSGWYKVERDEDATENPKVYLLSQEDGSITATAGKSTPTTCSAVVLPWTYNDISNNVTIKFKVAVNTTIPGKDGAPDIVENILTRDLSGTWSPDWKMGYKYTYNIAISGSTTKLEAIAFTTITDSDGQAVTDWTPADGATIRISA